MREDGNITFSVNSDSKVENASLTNATGDTVKVSVVFSDLDEKKVSFYSRTVRNLIFREAVLMAKTRLLLR